MLTKDEMIKVLANDRENIDRLRYLESKKKDQSTWRQLKLPFDGWIRTGKHNAPPY